MIELWRWLNANGGAVASAGTVATAATAIWALTRASLDSRERTRPLVVAYLENDENFGHSVMALVVKNAGASVARNLEVAFDPNLSANGASTHGLLTYVARRYAAVIPLLAPGAQLRNTWRVAGDVEGAGASAPRRMRAVVSYSHGRRRYKDDFVLDASAIESETGAMPQSSRMSLEAIAKAAELMAKS